MEWERLWPVAVGILPGLLTYGLACLYKREVLRIQRGVPSLLMRWRLWRARRIIEYLVSHHDEDALSIAVALSRLSRGVRCRLRPLVDAGYVHAFPTPIREHSRYRLSTAGLRYAYRHRQNPAELSPAEVGVWRAAIDRADEPKPRDPIADYEPGQWRDTSLDPPAEVEPVIVRETKHLVLYDRGEVAHREPSPSLAPKPGQRTATVYGIDGTAYTQIIG